MSTSIVSFNALVYCFVSDYFESMSIYECYCQLVIHLHAVSLDYVGVHSMLYTRLLSTYKCPCTSVMHPAVKRMLQKVSLVSAYEFTSTSYHIRCFHLPLVQLMMTLKNV